jgi:hypothetical protein
MELIQSWSSLEAIEDSGDFAFIATPLDVSAGE